MASFSSLPLDLIEEIFHKTPPEALLRSKPTCRKWHALITNKRFIYEHLRRSQEQRRFLRIDETVQIMDPVTRTHLETPIPNELQPRENINAMVHCDGLMLCMMCSDLESRLAKLAIWNPLTRNIKWIEPSRCFTAADYYGIGYENVQDGGYKILRFADRHDVESEVEIYNCKTSSWRTLDVEVDWCVDFTCQGVAVMGNMYWLAHRVVQEEFESYILGFDFTAETFKNVCFCFSPPDFDNNYLSCFDGDRLSLLQQDEEEAPSLIEVWVTNKLGGGDAVSFTKYFSVASPDLPWLRFDRDLVMASHPVYYVAAKNNKRIVAWCEGVVAEGYSFPLCIILYEMDEGGLRDHRVTERHYEDDYAGSLLCGYVYVPSLVPLPV